MPGAPAERALGLTRIAPHLSLATGLMPRSLLRSDLLDSGGEWQKASISTYGEDETTPSMPTLARAQPALQRRVARAPATPLRRDEYAVGQPGGGTSLP